MWHCRPVARCVKPNGWTPSRYKRYFLSSPKIVMAGAILPCYRLYWSLVCVSARYGIGNGVKSTIRVGAPGSGLGMHPRFFVKPCKLLLSRMGTYISTTCPCLTLLGTHIFLRLQKRWNGKRGTGAISRPVISLSARKRSTTASGAMPAWRDWNPKALQQNMCSGRTKNWDSIRSLR